MQECVTPASQGESSAPKARVWRWWVRVLLIDAAAALSVPLFQGFLDQRATLGGLLRQYLYSIIYANLIGIPLSAAVPAVWVRTVGQPAALRIVLRLSVIVAGTFSGCLLAGLVLRLIIGSGYEFWSDFERSFGISLVLSAVVVAFVSMFEVQQARLRETAMRLKTNELERERALKLATEARLSSLEARIHPHFLFNTINSVSSLIHEDPEKAEKVLSQLAALLRFSLDSAQGGLVPLAKELQIVEDYLAIEKVRFGARLRYAIRVPAELGGLRVPALAIQTLVENSVKYAVSARGRGASLEVSAEQADGRVRLHVKDDGPGFGDLRWPAGHGLDNLQERLNVLFGEDAALSVRSDALETVVTVEIRRAVPERMAGPAAAEASFA